MAIAIQATIMRKPGDSAASPSPSFIGLIGTNTIASVTPYAGGQSGVNAVIKVRYNDGRSLMYKGNYYVNETVAVTKTNINT